MNDLSPLVSLFGEAPVSPRKGLSAFAISGCVHGIGFGVLLYALHSAPRVIEDAIHYPVRTLSLTMTAPLVRYVAPAGSGSSAKSAVSSVRTPGVAGATSAAADSGRRAEHSLAEIATHSAPAPQTVVQPEVQAKILLPHATPLPQVVLWKPETMPVSKIVPPAPQPPTTAEVKPSLTVPNHEKVLADVPVSASVTVSPLAALEPSTTSPLVVHTHSTVQQLQETTSAQHLQPTPTAVLSISPIKMAEGTLVLPAVNQTAVSTAPPGPPSPVKAERAPSAGTGTTGAGFGSGSGSNRSQANSSGGNGAAQAKADASSKPGSGGGNATAGAAKSSGTAGGGQSGQSPQGAVASAQAGAGNGAGAAKPAAEKPGDRSGNGAAAAGEQADATEGKRITFPIEGHFGAVVIGSNMEDVYPETQGMWSDRLAYTVYLHVGLPKTWVLQYAVPSAAGTAAAATRPEAPWPYDILRPRLAAGDINADALLIHGFVNASGRFEQLSIAFPPDFAAAKAVLSALEKWKFRPAMQQGQAIMVEVLLIVPDASIE